MATGARSTPFPDHAVPRPRASPWRLGGLSAGELLARVRATVFAGDAFDRAAALSYYFLLALFPMLLFLTALLGLFQVPGLMDRLLSYAADVLPPDVASLLDRTFDEIVKGASRGLISAGALATLWAASRGARSVIAALNEVNAVTQGRPWWRRQLVAVVLTLAFALFTLTALLLLAFGERIGRAIALGIGLGAAFEGTWRIVQWPIALVFGIVGLDLTYYLAPAVRPRWALGSPGSVLAMTGWLVVSLGLRVYVARVGAYNATYGSIGAVILLMLWLYLSALALLVGAHVNAVIARAAAERTRAAA